VLGVARKVLVVFASSKRRRRHLACACRVPEEQAGLSNRLVRSS